MRGLISQRGDKTVRIVQIVSAAVLRGLSGAGAGQAVVDIVQQVLRPVVSVGDLQEAAGGTQTSNSKVVEADLQPVDHRKQDL